MKPPQIRGYTQFNYGLLSFNYGLLSFNYGLLSRPEQILIRSISDPKNISSVSGLRQNTTKRNAKVYH